MDELRRLLKTGSKLGPGMHGKDFMLLRHYCDFEGHGRASEMWEEHWHLHLPHIQAYWRDLHGKMRRCNPGIAQTFHARTYKEVIAQAKQWVQQMGDDLEWIP